MPSIILTHTSNNVVLLLVCHYTSSCLGVRPMNQSSGDLTRTLPHIHVHTRTQGYIPCRPNNISKVINTSIFSAHGTCNHRPQLCCPTGNAPTAVMLLTPRGGTFGERMGSRKVDVAVSISNRRHKSGVRTSAAVMTPSVSVLQ